MATIRELSQDHVNVDEPHLSPELLQWLAEQAGEIEAERRLSAEVLAALRDARCLRMAVSSEYGGADLSLPATLAVIQSLARADGAIGWAVGQVALSQIMLGYLPAVAQAELYADGPDLLAAGAAAPKGRATPVPGGWRISGQWPLVSGADYAAWIFLQCIVFDGGQLRAGPDGTPHMRMAVLPATSVTVVPTWDAVGLLGTGSHDVRVERVECADTWSCELASAPAGSAAVARIPPPTQGGLFVGACALGIAEGALDALTELARGGKRPAFSARRLGEQPIVQDRLGDAILTLEAAQALLGGELARADRLALEGELEPLDRARLRAAAVKAIELATRVVDAAYSLGGSSSVYARSPLQRRLRDAHTATQHFTAGRDFYTPLGALLVGEPGPHGML